MVCSLNAAVVRIVVAVVAAAAELAIPYTNLACSYFVAVVVVVAAAAVSETDSVIYY